MGVIGTLVAGRMVSCIPESMIESPASVAPVVVDVVSEQTSVIHGVSFEIGKMESFRFIEAPLNRKSSPHPRGLYRGFMGKEARWLPYRLSTSQQNRFYV